MAKWFMRGSLFGCTISVDENRRDYLLQKENRL